MPSIHRIRLGPPWESTPLPDGRVRHVRRFGKPRTLDANEKVFVVCDDLPGPSVVSVNGTVLPVAVGDITPLLQPRNELVVEMASADPPKAARLEVWG